MVLDTGRHAGQMKDDVCSSGGITITGVHAMEKGGVRYFKRYFIYLIVKYT